MISSTLRIISAASVADSKTACLTLNDSDMPRSAMSPTCQNVKNCQASINDDNPEKRIEEVSRHHIHLKCPISVFFFFSFSLFGYLQLQR